MNSELQQVQVEEVIEIRDPALSVDEVVRRIQANLAHCVPMPEMDLPSFSFAHYQADTSDYFDDETYYNLEQANRVYDQIWIDHNLIPSTVPIVGRLLTRFKRELHNLVTYYVNLLAGRQATFNEHIVRVVNGMMAKLSQDRVEELEARITELERRIAQLESEKGTKKDF